MRATMQSAISITSSLPRCSVAILHSRSTLPRHLGRRRIFASLILHLRQADPLLHISVSTSEHGSTEDQMLIQALHAHPSSRYENRRADFDLTGSRLVASVIPVPDARTRALYSSTTNVEHSSSHPSAHASVTQSAISYRPMTSLSPHRTQGNFLYVAEIGSDTDKCVPSRSSGQLSRAIYRNSGDPERTGRPYATQAIQR
jgi:hypothetical protein